MLGSAHSPTAVALGARSHKSDFVPLQSGTWREAARGESRTLTVFLSDGDADGDVL